MAVWRRQEISGKVDIAVHTHADRAGGVPPAVFMAFVEKVVVSGTKKDVRLKFVLRDGSEYKVDGVR